MILKPEERRAKLMHRSLTDLGMAINKPFVFDCTPTGFLAGNIIASLALLSVRPAQPMRNIKQKTTIMSQS